MEENTKMSLQPKALTQRYPFFVSIRGRLYLLLLSVLIPVLLIQSGYLYVRFKARMESESRANLEMSRAVAGTFNGFVKDILHQELAIGINLTSPQSLSVVEMNRILEANRVEHPAVRRFSWLDSGGHIIASSLGSDAGLDLGDRDYVREIISGREWVVSNLVVSRSSGEPTFVISRAIRGKDGNLLGIVAAGIIPDSLGDLLSLELSEDGAITIIDGSGMAVYQYPKREWGWEGRYLLKTRPAIKKALDGMEITGIFPCFVTGEERVAALSPISPIGWAAAVGRSKQALMAPVISQLLQQAGLFFILMIVVFGGAFIISKTITSPIRRLWEHAMALGSGDPKKPIEVSGSEELKDLASALNAMVEKVEARERDLKASQKRLLSVLEAVPASVYLQAPDYSIQFANHTFRQTFDDPEGKSCYEALCGRTEPCEGCFQSRTFNTQTLQQWEWSSPAGKSYSIHTHPLTDIDGSPLVLKLCLDITERKRMEGALRDLPSRLIQVQEEERKRLAGELHDSIGQTLAAIKFNIEFVLGARKRGNSEEALTLLEQFVPTLQRSIEETRAIYTGLRPKMLEEMGLLATIRWFCREFMDLYPKHHVELEISLDEKEIPEELKIVIFRISQEALNNISKHSKAEWVDLSLERKEHAIELIISDDGVGMDLDFILKNPNATSLGLTSMRERAELTGGVFHLKSTPGEGTTIHASWPIGFEVDHRTTIQDVA